MPKRVGSIGHWIALAIAWILLPQIASATAIYPGPSYSKATLTGVTLPAVYGTADGVGFITAYTDLAGKYLGRRAFRYTPSGWSELGHLGLSSTGVTEVYGSAMNSTGAAVGNAQKFSGTSELGTRAIRWGPASNLAVELGHLGTDVYGFTESEGRGINAAGDAVGFAVKHLAGDFGQRAVRWNAGGTAATELGNLGLWDNGWSQSRAHDINLAGTAVGYARKFGPNNQIMGERAIRWDAGTTTATELGNLSGPDSGYSFANRINASGTAIGVSIKRLNGIDYGERAVRWDANTTAITELTTLGTDPNGVNSSAAYDINSAGLIVGLSHKYDEAGNGFGDRAVVWDAAGNPRELASLYTKPSGYSSGVAFAINDSGFIVGGALKYMSANNVDSRAVLWTPDGTPIDLGSLLDPDSGWRYLTQANDISDDNWISGIGLFDPDGAGPILQYPRAFLMQLPEPSLLLPLSLLLLRLRRRH